MRDRRRMAFDVNAGVSSKDRNVVAKSESELDQIKRWHADFLINNKPDLGRHDHQHLDWFLYPLLIVAILLTLFFVVLLVVIIRKYKSNKTYLAEHEVLQLDKMGSVKSSHDKSYSMINSSANKYGTLENIKNESETVVDETSTKSQQQQQHQKIKPSPSWPFNTFLLKNLNLLSNVKSKHKTEYSLSKFDETDASSGSLADKQKEKASNTGYTSNHHAEMVLNNELISKLSPVRLNYSVKYENRVLKLDIISIETDHVLNVTSFNPYVRIELINENLKSMHSNEKLSEALVNEDEDTSQFKICKTRVIRNAVHPVYNETFVFKNVKSLIEFKLVLSVYSSNRFTRDLFIGQLIHEFEVLDDAQSLQHSYSKELVYENNESLNDKHGTGEVTVSLCYKTSSQTIYVNLVKADYLPYVNKNNLPNPFVKIFLTYNGERLTKKLGKIFMQTRSPTLNETFEFNLSKYLNTQNTDRSYTLEQFGVCIVLLDWNPIEKCEQLGEIHLCSNNEKSEEISSCVKNVFEKQNEPLLATYKILLSTS